MKLVLHKGKSKINLFNYFKARYMKLVLLIKLPYKGSSTRRRKKTNVTQHYGEDYIKEASLYY